MGISFTEFQQTINNFNTNWRFSLPLYILNQLITNFFSISDGLHLCFFDRNGYIFNPTLNKRFCMQYESEETKEKKTSKVQKYHSTNYEDQNW